MIWLPASSSAGIGDAANASVNVMDRRPGDRGWNRRPVLRVPISYTHDYRSALRRKPLICSSIPLSPPLAAAQSIFSTPAQTIESRNLADSTDEFNTMLVILRVGRS
jgi:hypothetical protein